MNNIPRTKLAMKQLLIAGLMVLLIGGGKVWARGSVRHSGSSKKSNSRQNSSPGASNRNNNRSPNNKGRNSGGNRSANKNVNVNVNVNRGHGRGRHHNWHDARRHRRRIRRVNHVIRAGVYWASRPRYSTTVVVTGTTYYYWGGLYYVSSGSGYVVVSPPPNAVVYAIPVAATPVYAGTSEFYYYDGTYYVPTTKPAEKPEGTETSVTADVSADGEGGETTSETVEAPEMTQDDSNYEVVGPPVGAAVPYLPDDAKEETVQGKKYFEFEGTYYRAFASDGETVYMVVENPNGNV